MIFWFRQLIGFGTAWVLVSCKGEVLKWRAYWTEKSYLQYRKTTPTAFKKTLGLVDTANRNYKLCTILFFYLIKCNESVQYYYISHLAFWTNGTNKKNYYYDLPKIRPYICYAVDGVGLSCLWHNLEWTRKLCSYLPKTCMHMKIIQQEKSRTSSFLACLLLRGRTDVNFMPKAKTLCFNCRGFAILMAECFWVPPSLSEWGLNNSSRPSVYKLLGKKYFTYNSHEEM